MQGECRIGVRLYVNADWTTLYLRRTVFSTVEKLIKGEWNLK